MGDRIRCRQRTTEGARRWRVVAAARRGGAACRRASSGCRPSSGDADGATERARRGASARPKPRLGRFRPRPLLARRLLPLRFLQEGITVRLQLSLMLAFLVNAPAGADEPLPSLPVACAVAAEL